MNKSGKILGSIFSNPIIMIVVFFSMLLFVITAGFISSSYQNEENIAHNFANSYIIFNDEVVTVEEAVKKECLSGSGRLYFLSDGLKEILKKEFSERYGYGYAFVLATRSVASFDINARYFIHSKFGVFETSENEIPLSDFEKVFDAKAKNYDVVGLCGLNLFVKRLA